jgi:hypothetical protein
VSDEFLWSPLHLPLRWAIAVLSVISAAAHLPVLSEHLAEVPYIGVEFIVLIVACLLIAIAAPAWDTAALYAVAAITCALAVSAYVMSRAVTLPGLADDVGDWFEPLGVVAILAESATVVVAISAVAQHYPGAKS